jgi:hypothetical protein
VIPEPKIFYVVYATSLITLAGDPSAVVLVIVRRVEVPPERERNVLSFFRYGSSVSHVTNLPRPADVDSSLTPSAVTESEVSAKGVASLLLRQLLQAKEDLCGGLT